MQITITETLPPGTYTLVPFVAPIPVPPEPIPTPEPGPAKRWPVGKGYYVWNLKNCGNGNPGVIVDMCQAAGINWVGIKLHDGPNAHANVASLPPVLAALRAAGIKVWGWGYNYAIKPADEARKGVELVKRFGLEGYLIDVEHEYKDAPGQSVKRAAAQVFCGAFRAAAPDMAVGLASYRYPTLHMNLAWDVFAKIIDFHNPQVYWMGTSLPTQPAMQLDRSIRELKRVKDVPVIPIGVASPDDLNQWKPTIAQIDNFYARVKELGLEGHCWWSFEHAQRRPEVWQAIAAHR